MDPREGDGVGWVTTGLTATAMLAFAANSLLCRAAPGGGRADAATFTMLRLAVGALALAVAGRRRGGKSPTGCPVAAER